MCRIVYQKNGLVFYKPVYCSTDPEKLAAIAKYYADQWEVKILAIEPCVLQLFTDPREQEAQDAADDLPPF